MAFLRLYQALCAFGFVSFATAWVQESQTSRQVNATSCSALVAHLDLPSATIYSAQYIVAGTNLSLPENNVTCAQPFQTVPSDICRVTLYVATSNSSGVNMEAWLPTNWTGRFLGTGNGGLDGCISYGDLAYGSSLGFASVGTNNGHNGTSGEPFYKHPEVVADFAYRALHTGVVVGKQITKAYFGTAQKKSYYLGCSTGGRQGFRSAQDFPEDFDGIVAGAPALAFNNLTSWSGHFYPLTGPPGAATFVTPPQWALVHADILKQCDLLDGYADGIIEDASICNYNASGLLCSNSTSSSTCLTSTQVATVQKVFSPLYDADGSLVFPRMQPGSEILDSYIYYAGQPFPYTTDWFRYVVYNDPSWDPAQINSSDYDAAVRAETFGIQTWKGDLSKLRDRGAKLLHWHGQMDMIITSENSPRYYEHVSNTMGLQSEELDEFYRFFRVSGTGHCEGGDGAFAIGQDINSVQSYNSSENILIAMVNWVENGVAPNTVTGTRWVNGTQSWGVDYKRAHCKYPKRNVYQGVGDPKAVSSWKCV